MKKKHSRFLEVVLVFMGIIFFVSVKAIAVGTLIPIASAIYDSGDSDYASSVTADNDGNIIVVGATSNGTYWNYYTLKYDSNLLFLSSVTYDGWASDVLVDSNNNIIAAGRSFSSDYNCDYFTIKYDQNLMFISSATYDRGIIDRVSQIAVDSNDNIIITGHSSYGPYGSNEENYDYFTIKYDHNLIFIGSVAYDGGTHDFAGAVVVDSNDNIIVSGKTGDITASDYFTIKYDSNLAVISSVSLGDGRIALDSNDNIVIARGIKYNSDLIFMSSATYPGWAQGVVVDTNDNIIISGCRYIERNRIYFTLKYNQNFVLLSSATCHNNTGYAWQLAVDNNDNIICVGGVSNGINLNCFIVKYNGCPPEISSLSPSFGRRGESFDFTINGLNLFSGASIIFSGDGITINSVKFKSSTQLQLNISIAENASLGTRDITVTNIDEVSGTIRAGFQVRLENLLDVGMEVGTVKVQGGEKGYVNPAKGEQATIHFRAERIGEIKIRIYTLKGQLVWEKSKETTGEEDFILWDCKNSCGRVISSGIYIIHINSPGINTTKKIAILK